MVTRNNIWRLLTLLVTAVGLTACIYDPLTDPGSILGNSTLVKLEVRIQGSNMPETRALQSPQEDEVFEVTVFAFDKGENGNWDTRLRHIGKSIGPPQGTGSTKEFTVELYSGEWDLWVVANAGDFSDDLITQALTKSDLQAVFVKTQTTKWDVDPTDASGAYRIPMWGMLDAVRIETSSTGISGAVNLYRMLTKIDVEVQRTPDSDNPENYPGIPMSQFELTYVSLHNYNTTGRIVPGITAQDGDWTNATGGGALRTSLPASPGTVNGWQPANRLEWSNPTDFTTAGTALKGTIYTFEADAGTTSSNRPCIIIGGKYNESDEVTYYRADFLDGEKKYLNLLRNHKYTFLVRKIGGKGFPSVEDAYEAGPTNLEAEVIQWNDGGFLEGVWDGTYEIRFSGRKAHFTQFGEPTPQIIRVRSNVPSLTFEEFGNITSASGDDVWTETGTGTWTNGHFTVVIEKTDTMGEYSDYSITITTEPTTRNDPERSSMFKVKGYMLEAEMFITQDHHIEYRLQSSPDSTYPIGIDGTQQRVKINVLSTHPYKIDFMGYDMFDGVYGVATSGTPIDQTNIPITTSEVYIGVKGYSGQDARVGEFYIQHLDPLSDAPAKVYSILQLTPIIIAELEEGGLVGQLSRRGGEKVIKITSNLAGWNPILFINDIQYTGDLSTYFNIVNGVKSQNIIFTAPQLPVGTTSDVVYKIKFRDTNNATETATYITITQKVLSATPPTGGTNAPEWILAVDSNGELNLDGRGYVVFFKWGSTVAISGASPTFNATQIAWAPEEYDVSIIGDNFDMVPYANGATYPNALPPNLPTQGLGDPCRLASKGGVVGRWKMPTTTTFNEVRTGSANWITKNIQGVNVKGRMDTTVFYPAAGKYASGSLSEVNQTGYYWSSVSGGTNLARNLYFNQGTVITGQSSSRAVGYAIRCVPE